MRRCAVVTGIASGMGKYIAEKLSEKDFLVFGADIKNVELPNVKSHKVDVSDEKQVHKFIEIIKNETDRIDCLINVAGILCDKERNRIENLSSKEWKKVLEVNLDSVFYMSKYSIPMLKKSNNASIVNFSSDQVYKAKNKSAPYAISKAAVEMFTKICARELICDSIRANTIALASVETNFIKNLDIDEYKYQEMIKTADEKMPFGIIKVEDVWDLIEYLIKDNCKITGQTILVDSGTLL